MSYRALLATPPYCALPFAVASHPTAHPSIAACSGLPHAAAHRAVVLSCCASQNHRLALQPTHPRGHASRPHAASTGLLRSIPRQRTPVTRSAFRSTPRIAAALLSLAIRRLTPRARPTQPFAAPT